MLAATTAARACDPNDVAKLRELIEHVKALETQLSTSSRREFTELCALVRDVCEVLARGGDAKPESAFPWVVRLLEFMSKATGADAKAIGAPDGGVKLSTTALHKRLSLVDGHRLGEILIRMSYLRVQDVEKALATQRQKNCKLGDALIALDLLSREELEAALRVQKQKRNRQLDPWMDSFGRDENGEPKQKRPRSA